MNRTRAFALVWAGLTGLLVVGSPSSRALAAGEKAAPAELLRAADAALDAGDRARARALFDRLAREFPAEPEASEARRALKIFPAVPPLAASPPSSPRQEEVVVRRELYSTRTAERLRLTTWEKMDFGVTSFIYGLSVGVSFSLAQSGGSSVGPPVLGALVYTGAAIAFLQLADPDRGDLPLALAITSYVPTATLLVSDLAFPNASDRNRALAVASAGLLSLPIAVVAARHFDLDPGDTQLVRDSGFWGLVLATTGTLWLGTRVSTSDTPDETPSTKSAAVAGLLGLSGGLGLGMLAAAHSDVSLERVRVTTWGGYGGALVGALLGASGNGDRGLWGGLTMGAACGLILTFATTGGLDGIPAPDAPAVGARSSVAPTVASALRPDGHRMPVFGLMGALP
jgi:hypothetical protein